MVSWRYPLLLAATGLLVSCSSTPLRDSNWARQWPADWAQRDWAQRSATLQAFERFDVAGRMAIARGESGASATLRWQQRGDESTLELEGPLGLAANRFRYRPGEESAWRTLEEQLGFALPAASLRYWLLGVADPRAPAAEQLSSEDLPVLRSLEQAAWQLEFSQYAPIGDSGLRLPTRIEARHLDAAGEWIRVRLVIQRWGAGR